MKLRTGLLWILARNEGKDVDFIANRYLPRNESIRAGDVSRAPWNPLTGRFSFSGPQEADFIGRYMTGDVPRGATLRYGVTDTAPNILLRAGRLLIVAQLARDLAGKTEAGMCGQLSIKDAPEVTIAAMLCPSSAMANCSAIMDVPFEAATKLTADKDHPLAVASNDRLVIPDAPPGALIGRIGGSSAGLKADGAFVIGASCVATVPTGSVGPLFVGFNIVARPVQVANIAIKVSKARPNI